MEFTFIQKVAIWALPVLFAITVHEVAHGWAALCFGDKTAKLSGRLTLNPIKHIDMMGTVVVPLLMLMVSNFIFGWAKPVPVDARNMRHPRTDMIVVSLAGPVANFIMALLWALLVRYAVLFPGTMQSWLVHMGFAGVFINLVLGVLNCLPIPPLDGGRALCNILPPRLGWMLYQVEPYGFVILILLMMTGALSLIMAPAMYFFLSWFSDLFGVNFLRSMF